MRHSIRFRIISVFIKHFNDHLRRKYDETMLALKAISLLAVALQLASRAELIPW